MAQSDLSFWVESRGCLKSRQPLFILPLLVVFLVYFGIEH
jgi:hypothetical protein